MGNSRLVSNVKIAVVDDHPIFRAGVIEVLKAEPGFSVVGEGATAEDALRVAKAVKPDVMLLDVSIPGGGLEAARAISMEVPRTRIAMLTVVAEESFVLSALGAGAKGYVLKGISGRELVRTIWSLLNGAADECFVNAGLGGHLHVSSDRARRSPVVARRITDIDRQILSMATTGRTDHDIARSLGLETGEVEFRLADINDFVRLASAAGSERTPFSSTKLH